MISPDSILEIGDIIWRQLENGEITLEQAKNYFGVMKVYRTITPDHKPLTLLDLYRQHVEEEKQNVTQTNS